MRSLVIIFLSFLSFFLLAVPSIPAHAEISMDKSWHIYEDDGHSKSYVNMDNIRYDSNTQTIYFWMYYIPIGYPNSNEYMSKSYNAITVPTRSFYKLWDVDYQHGALVFNQSDDSQYINTLNITDFETDTDPDFSEGYRTIEPYSNRAKLADSLLAKLGLHPLFNEKAMTWKDFYTDPTTGETYSISTEYNGVAPDGSYYAYIRTVKNNKVISCTLDHFWVINNTDQRLIHYLTTKRGFYVSAKYEQRIKEYDAAKALYDAHDY